MIVKKIQNDLRIDNLIAHQETTIMMDFRRYIGKQVTTCIFRALMHVDGNIQYANYQNETQVREYLTSNGYSSEISDIVS